MAQFFNEVIEINKVVMMIKKSIVVTVGSFLAVCVLALTACSKNDKNDSGFKYETIQPSGSKPVWAPDITDQMLAVIEALDSLGAKPVYELTVAQARAQPTPADAVKAVMTKFNVPVVVANVDTAGQDIAVDGGSIHLRMYTPKTGKSSYPAIVYYHGGGWVIATVDTYNRSAQALAEKTDAVVVAVEYRKGPEFRFPTAHNDAFAGYQWVLNNAAKIKVDTNHVALAGESAGGNLAVNVSIMARDNNVHMPAHQIIVYPVASKDSTLASRLQYTMAVPLGTPALPWFLGNFLNSPTEAADPRIDLVNSDLANLPSTTIIGAELDPLQTEGKQLADAFQSAGVTVTYQLYNGVTHEFFGMDAVVPQAKDAQDFAAEQLKNALK